MFQTLLAIVVLIADIYAILTILQTSARVEQKTVWIAIIILLPLFGIVAWYFAGPGGRGN
jgi:hypothetical protein